MSIFDHSDYKIYCTARLAEFPNKGRGARSRLAAFSGCQVAYVSQVLNGNVHFTLEQGERINRFFSHTREESHYFMLLLQLGRAGSKELEAYFRDQVEQALERHLTLKNRVDVKESLSQEHQLTYYSSWIYAAIHILVTIPQFQTRGAIASRLGLPGEDVSEALDFLSATGLVREEAGRLLPGATRLYLGDDSPLISKHHANWRIKTLQSLERRKRESLHYSSVISLSKEDLIKIKARLVQEITEAKAIIRDSKEEVLCCFAVDLFEVP